MAIIGIGSFLDGSVDAMPLNTLRGSRTDSGGYLFPRLPSGHLRLRFSDGLSQSEWFELDLGHREEAEIEVLLPPPTGVVVELRTASGVSVHGAEFVGFTVLGEGPDTSSGTFHPGVNEYLGEVGGLPLRRLIPLEPGRYDICASKLGIGDGHTELEVRPGEVAIANIVVGGDE